jgi:hypothetical protein
LAATCRRFGTICLSLFPGSSSPFFSNCLSCEDGKDIVPKRRQPTTNVRRAASRKSQYLNYTKAEDKNLAKILLLWLLFIITLMTNCALTGIYFFYNKCFVWNVVLFTGFWILGIQQNRINKDFLCYGSQ